MDWTRLPQEDVLYIDHDEWIANNPITAVGSLYIEKESRWCKVGDGRRYTEIPYTPWSISAGAATVIKVENIVTSTTGLDVSKKYIWNGGIQYHKGYILEYVNSIWTQSIPQDNSLAWVSALYQLKFWDGVNWNSVDANTHNSLFGLEGGEDDHYYHLSEDDYINASRMSWRYPVNEIIEGEFPSSPAEGYRVAVSILVPAGNNSFNHRGDICEYRGGQWVFEPQVEGQTIVNLSDGFIYVWREYNWHICGVDTSTSGIRPLTPVSRNCLLTWNDNLGIYAKDADVGAYVKDCLFVRHPYNTRFADYKLKTYASGDTETYGGIVGIENDKFGYTCGGIHPRIGFAANAITQIKQSEFGGGFFIFGCCAPNGHSRVFIGVKPIGSITTIEALSIGSNGITQCNYGINIPVDKTYNIGGGPHRHDERYLRLSGGTMDGVLDMGMHRLTNLPLPQAAGEPVTLEYISGLFTGVVWQQPVLSIKMDPPEVDGRYLVSPTGVTGAFVTHENDIAIRTGGVWTFVSPLKNWGVFNKDDGYNYLWNEEEWLQIPSTTSHSALQNLTSDDHLQYVHISDDRVISAIHTFNAPGVSPFLVTSNVMVDNLNANFLGGIPAEGFALVDHEHELDWVELGGFSITNPVDGDTFVFESTINKFINAPMNSVSVLSQHVFDNNSERDAYFVLHPDDMRERLFCIVSDVLQMYEGNPSMYDSDAWHDRMAFLRGTNGRDGIDGDIGPQGIQGVQGIQGAAGPMGPQGAPGTAINIVGSVANEGLLPLTGNEEHDAYYCVENGDCYAWLSGAWVNIGKIQGPQGPQGIQGPQGPQGITGPPGAIGPSGPTGPQGEVGERGPAGMGDPSWQSPVEKIADYPPYNYDNGDRFIISLTPSGVFEGHERNIASFTESDPPGNGTWLFEEPGIGWTVYVGEENCHYAFGVTGWTKIQGEGGSGTTDHRLLTDRDAVEAHPASAITVDTTNFNKNLNSGDNTVQAALEKLDELIGSGTSSFLGWFDTEAALEAAYPTANDGNYAFVYDTDTIWNWDGSVWVNTFRKSNTLEPLDPLQNCLTAWNDNDGAYIKSANQGAYVQNGLFVKVPHSTGLGKYKVKTYGDTFTESYAGIVDITDYVEGTNYNYPGVGFVCNMIDGINTARFGAGVIISGHDYTAGYFGQVVREPYIALAIKPANGEVSEPLRIGKDGVVRCSPGIITSTINIPSGQTYNVNGTPHHHNGLYLSTLGGTLSGNLNMSNHLITNVANPVSGTDAVNLDTVAGLISGSIWQTPVSGITNSVPQTPQAGSRYVVGTTPAGEFYGHDAEIATWDGAEWTYEEPQTGWCVSNKADNYAYNYNGTIWVQLPGASAHNALTGLSGDDHTQYVHTTLSRTVTGTITFDRMGSPFAVTSATMVAHLNANYLEGLRASAFSLVAHTHELADLTGVSLANLTDGQILAYSEELGAFVNTNNQGGSGALSMNPNHQFSDNTERDAYFATHLSELENGTFIAVGSGFQQYDSVIVDPYNASAWIDRTAVIRGPAGADGRNGIDGARGPQGIQGPAGAAGATGPQGPPGSPGTSINIIGSVVNAAALPASAENYGDAYWCESESVCYAWTENGWISVGAIVGPAGPQGVVGPQGPTGPQGIQGEQGEIGPEGPQGVAGEIGPRGPNGFDNPYYQEAIEGILNAPPQVYDYGDRFIVGSTPTGVWVGHSNQIATWMNTDQWYYENADVGWAAYDLTDKVHRVWNGLTWVRWESTGGVWGSITGSVGDQTDLAQILSGKVNTIDVGANNGIAELDENGKVPSTQLPSYVDDVIEYADFEAFPAVGEASKIYIDTTENKTYRWSGTQYVMIGGGGVALGETSATAFRGDYGKIAYDHSQVAHAPSTAEQNVQADWNVSDDTNDAFIKNKPTIPGAYTLPTATGSVLGGVKIGSRLTITNGVLSADEQGGGLAKVSSNDTTAGYLNGKLVAGAGISLTENNNGANETLSVGVSAVFQDVSAYYTLPGTPTVGLMVEVVGKGNNWRLTAPAGYYIRDGADVSAAAGNLSSTLGYDCASVVYIGSNVWLVKSSKGVLTIDAA